MRKIVALLSLSLDGFYEGRGQDLSWHRVDEEFDDYASRMLTDADYLLMGRVTYEGMAAYWPDHERRHPDDPIARLMNRKPKLVASRTLTEAGYENTRLLGRDALAELRRIKAEPGECILILGSGTLVDALRREGLIDEYRIILTPVLVGSGNALFRDGAPPAGLELVSAWPMKSGNVVLRYAVNPG